MAKLEAKMNVDLNLLPLERDVRAIARTFWEAAERIERIRKGFGEATLEDIEVANAALASELHGDISGRAEEE